MRITHDIWTDLADRESDGLEVTLLWSKPTGRVKVAVSDSRRGDAFELDVPAAEALAAFHHPFAYATDSRLVKHPQPVHTDDLQLQT